MTDLQRDIDIIDGLFAPHPTKIQNPATVAAWQRIRASLEQAPTAAAVPEPMPPVPDSTGLSREQREVENAFRRGWNSCRARVMQLNAYALAERKEISRG